MPFLARRYLRFIPLVLVSVVSSVVPPSTAEEPGDDGTSRHSVSAEGSLAWLSADELDLVGELGVDLPWTLTPSTEIYLGIWTQTAITESLDDFTFDVREINYSAELGVRHELSSGPTLGFLAGQDGKALVDADGSAFVRYVAVGAESRTRRGSGLYWTGALGPVLDDHGISADGWARLELHWDLTDTATGWDGLGVDLEVDGLFEDGSFDADIRIGPHYAFLFEDRYRISLFAHYLDSENPLGLGASGVLVGLEYYESPGGSGARVRPPAVHGRVAVGVGGDRAAGRMALDLQLPPFGEAGWLVADLDVNALSGDDTDELYYFYRLGYEWEMWEMVTGAYFYHRSNHQLSNLGTEVTSINVVEFGVETPSWRGAVRSDASSGWGRLDWSGHGGFLLSSSFGEDHRWWIYGAARWLLPGRVGPFVPLIEAEIEEGDAGRYSVAVGVAGPSGTGLTVRYLEDDQLFGEDRSALLIVAERRF